MVPVVAGAARRREVRLVAAGCGWDTVARVGGGGSAMRGTSAGSAESQLPAQKPNPALHLTPPASL
ncbi:hypothetical protein [Gemmata obscuriglobus]|uniref:Uncharacterized protein n=1 Tax=Gemmata obscuriglobus TaxID=114 RepID=A0A2Z3GV69_9BACT|nr:hypothetical protein [Gemmata obscuriglobus]AWM37623.1 hypothetical protein C1280_11855 [Gemmata obscuriglobus]